MFRKQECERHAAQCLELANAASNQEDRVRWLNMKKFWLQRAELSEPDATTKVVSLLSQYLGKKHWLP